MSDGEFDPERFEAEKYETYFTELQSAYKRAFETMNDAYDSTLVHAIDQSVLSESEPFFEADANDGAGGFRIELPGDARERVRNAGVVVDDDRLDAVFDRYREELRAELRREFGVGDN